MKIRNLTQFTYDPAITASTDGYTNKPAATPRASYQQTTKNPGQPKQTTFTTTKSTTTQSWTTKPPPWLTTIGNYSTTQTTFWTTTKKPTITTTKSVTTKPINCTQPATSSFPGDNSLILGVGLILVLGVVSLIGIQFYSIYTKNSRHQPRGPSRRSGQDMTQLESKYPGLLSYEGRIVESQRFVDVNSSSSDFDLTGIPHGNEVPITKAKLKYFQRNKKSLSSLPRNLKSNKVKKSPERHRNFNLNNTQSDEI